MRATATMYIAWYTASGGSSENRALESLAGIEQRVSSPIYTYIIFHHYGITKIFLLLAMADSKKHEVLLSTELNPW